MDYYGTYVARDTLDSNIHHNADISACVNTKYLPSGSVI